MPQVIINYDEWAAAESLAAKPYHFVQMGSDGIRAAATAGQQKILGVIQNAPAVGERALICGGGQTPVFSGVAITKGAALMSDAAGKAITAAVSSSSFITGIALEAASAAGVLFKMAFIPNAYTANDL